MNRRDKILPAVDLATACGLELGPLHTPLIEKSEANVTYADILTTDRLRVRYAHNPDVPKDKIVEVDHIWTAQGLPSVETSSIDYVIASHVVEHVPNLLGWLAELHRILKPSGTIGLAVPDRRFTFDFPRRETRIEDIVHASIVNATAPLPICVLDHLLNAGYVDSIQAWDEILDSNNIRRAHSDDFAIAAAKQALVEPTPNDLHCWVFTPRSMAEVFSRAAEIGLLPFKNTMFFDTQYYSIEFYVQMIPFRDRDEAAASWKKMASMAKDVEDLRPVAAPDRRSAGCNFMPAIR